MIQPINHDPIFLSRRSVPATIMDLPVAKDLEDTLTAHAEGCVGMAANMIGVAKNIIVFDVNGTVMTMLNPEIIRKSGAYETEEGCLSLPGVRKTKRYRSITVTYQDKSFRKQTREFTGFIAEIIQHEIDHCNGILI